MQKYVDPKHKLWHGIALIMYPTLFVKITLFENLHAPKICIQFKKILKRIVKHVF
jgi:hypothetical protein